MFDATVYAGLLSDVNNAATNQEKGESFEELTAYLFSLVEGVEVHDRNCNSGSEEIDIVLWNAQTQVEFKPFDFTILVECKNWSKPANAKELDNFVSKMRRRDSKFGIFVAANGVTGDFINGDNADGALDIIKASLREGYKVVVINKDDLDGIASMDDFLRIIKSRYCDLFAHKILGPIK